MRLQRMSFVNRQFGPPSRNRQALQPHSGDGELYEPSSNILPRDRKIYLTVRHHSEVRTISLQTFSGSVSDPPISTLIALQCMSFLLVFSAPERG